MKLIFFFLFFFVLIHAKFRKTFSHQTEKETFTSLDVNCQNLCKNIPLAKVCGKWNQSCCMGSCQKVWIAEFCIGMKMKLDC